MNAPPATLAPSHKTLTHALRFLSIDRSARIESGRPDTPAGMAEVAEVLWRGYLRHNPRNPHWPDRDRFVLSDRHASMLLYSLLYLTGYDLSIDEPRGEIVADRAGQGFAGAVGMALAERLLAAEFNRPGYAIVDHRTYVLLGDACLKKRISHEAAALAGGLGLHKLIAFYDDTGIAIGDDDRDHTPSRFQAYGWNVVRDVDGHDAERVEGALQSGHASGHRPTLICCRCFDGHAPTGSEKESAAQHAYMDQRTPPFEIPPAVRLAWDGRERGWQLEQSWRARFHEYGRVYPQLAVEFARRMNAHLLPDFQSVETLVAGLAKESGSTNSIARAAHEAFREASR